MSDAPASRRRPRWRRWLARASLALAIGAMLYVAWLDFAVTRRFTDPGGQPPAQVYARPLALYANAPIGRSALVGELERHGYRASASLETGAWRREGSRIDIMLRKARFPGRTREPMRIRVVAGSDRIAAVQDAAGKALRVVPLDPLPIGTLYPVKGEDRILVLPDEVPPLLPAALKAVEDRNFDDHGGIDLKAIVRAAWVNLRAGEVEQGGSTLTQQLVKSYFPAYPRTFWRKAREAIMAVLLEMRFDKAQLMQAYLNEIYMGQDGDRAIHGFGLASRFYFGKPLAELDRAEIALLVGLVQGPSYYNPRSHPDRAKARRDLVLAQLADQGVVTREEAAAAAAQPVRVVARRARADYPGYLDLVRRELQRDYGKEVLGRPGLQVYTSLDPRVQEVVEKGLAAELPKLQKRGKSGQKDLQAAAIVTAPASGEVLAVVGGRDPRLPGFNRALDARRPIGSLVKPVVYLAALETGQYHAASILNDGPVEVRFRNGKLWRPQNIDRETIGPLPLVRALAESRNLPTVQLGLEVGIEPVARKLRALGLERPVAKVPALLLGAVDMTPLEVAQMYGVFASGGVRHPLTAVRAVATSDGELLKRPDRKAAAAADPEAAYQLDRMLVEVMTRGTGRAGRARLPPELVTAGKSGTSSDLRDSWFAGFSGSHLAVAWIGHDDNSPVGLTGSQGALPVWAAIMGAIGQAPLSLPLPPGLDEVAIDYATGLVTEPGCEGETITVAVPRNVILEHSEDCYPRDFDDWFDRFQAWWRRVTGV